jgi:hypothetical protein
VIDERRLRRRRRPTGALADDAEDHDRKSRSSGSPGTGAGAVDHVASTARVLAPAASHGLELGSVPPLTSAGGRYIPRYTSDHIASDILWS